MLSFKRYIKQFHHLHFCHPWALTNLSYCCTFLGIEFEYSSLRPWHSSDTLLGYLLQVCADVGHYLFHTRILERQSADDPCVDNHTMLQISAASRWVHPESLLEQHRHMDWYLVCLLLFRLLLYYSKLCFPWDSSVAKYVHKIRFGPSYL